jgi:hypothetical protein
MAVKKRSLVFAHLFEVGLEQSALMRVARGHHHKRFRIRYAVEPFPAKPETKPPHAHHKIGGSWRG